ncbi:MAG: hypothetical protein Unbinned5081contig1002_26 [Prokaryotic dsDNA virus sp.]|nr:MAG: hypothetical protein Unbinned5081contig1002_26 [Prokaryotic dsDNA virus sp.]|tara:strand:- start:35161 stop:35352 length:192 start_codon:yes stop_codon:yes gene_type:complete
MENTTHEANKHAAAMAVEYLTEINTYNLKELGQERFQTLIEVITKNYHEKFAELEENTLDVPF